MSAITFKTKQINNSTPISNIFIEKYLPKANATYVKIYIYLYRFFYTNTQTSLKSVAANLSLLESDVINAIKYWESVGLMTLETNAKTTDYCINFVNLIDNALSSNKLANDDKENKKKPVENNYTPEEIGHILKCNAEIKEFISFIESKYASSFSPKNLTQIISMFDNLILPLDIYSFLVTYAHTKGITSINSMLAYIEKIAVSLCEKNIRTLAEAEKYLTHPPKATTSESKPNTKFVNFDQPDWDFDEIKRLEQEFIDEDVKRISSNKN